MKEKKSNLHLIELLDLTTNLQKLHGTKGQMKLHRRDAISKIQTQENSTGQTAWFLPKTKNKKEKRKKARYTNRQTSIPTEYLVSLRIIVIIFR